MRFRTLALALVLSCGVTGVVEAAKKPAVQPARHQKAKKYKPNKKFKQSKASKYKPRKAKKIKHASR